MAAWPTDNNITRRVANYKFSSRYFTQKLELTATAGSGMEEGEMISDFLAIGPFAFSGV